jgi:hypothetical protein
MSHDAPMTDEQLAVFHAEADAQWDAETFDRLAGATFSRTVPMKKWVTADYVDGVYIPDPIDHVRALRRAAQGEIRKHCDAGAVLFCQARDIRCYLDQQGDKWLLVTEAEFGAMAA